MLEEMELFPERRPEPIRSLRILHSQSVLFAGLRDHVAKIPLKRCPFYRSRRSGSPGRAGPSHVLAPVIDAPPRERVQEPRGRSGFLCLRGMGTRASFCVLHPRMQRLLIHTTLLC